MEINVDLSVWVTTAEGQTFNLGLSEEHKSGDNPRFASREAQHAIGMVVSRVLDQIVLWSGHGFTGDPVAMDYAHKLRYKTSVPQTTRHPNIVHSAPVPEKARMDEALKTLAESSLDNLAAMHKRNMELEEKVKELEGKRDEAYLEGYIDSHRGEASKVEVQVPPEASAEYMAMTGYVNQDPDTPGLKCGHCGHDHHTGRSCEHKLPFGPGEKACACNKDLADEPYDLTNSDDDVPTE